MELDLLWEQVGKPKCPGSLLGMLYKTQRNSFFLITGFSDHKYRWLWGHSALTSTCFLSPCHLHCLFLSLSVSVLHLTHSFYVSLSPCGKGGCLLRGCSLLKGVQKLKSEAQAEEAESWFYSKLKGERINNKEHTSQIFYNVTYFKCCGPLPTHAYLPLLEPWGQLLVQHMEFLCEKIKSGCLPWHPPRSPDSERNGSKMCPTAMMRGKILHKFQNLIISIDCS